MANDNDDARNEVNRNLIRLSEMKWEGLDVKGMIGAVIKTIKNNPDARNWLASEKNEDQIAFAKAVWDNGNTKVRGLCITTPNTWFMTLAGNEKMVPIIAAAFDRFDSSVGAGNPQAKEDYEEIAAKVTNLRPHVEAAKDDPFYEPQPTEGQIRMVQKFDKKAAENAGARDSHKPNEAAVTYPFILGKIMIEMKLDFALDTNMLKLIVDDVLRFCSIHGQKTVHRFSSKIATLDVITGPSSRIDIKPFFSSLLESDDFQTASGASEANKYTPNFKITLKRIVRLVYMCTKYKTVWGLMNARDDFVSDVVELFELEEEVDSPDMNSLAMIWYLAIERGNIGAIMVDHWERSASNALAMLLNNDQLDPLTPPDYVFPLDKDVRNRF
jgi:hypothetical protein